MNIWIIALLGGTAVFGWIAGNNNGFRKGMSAAPDNIAAELVAHQAAADRQQALKLAQIAARPTMLECLDLLGVDTIALEIEFRELIAESSNAAHDFDGAEGRDQGDDYR